ncbi:MAG: DUF4091 domain-containing protein [Clostridia bacterium]|nr:DUF4091 domain-containing protein [Clostridia bacterium]
MKKIISVIISALALTPLFTGCASVPDTAITERLTEAKTVITTEKDTETAVEQHTEEIIKAPDEDENVSVWYVNSYTKTDPDKPEDTGISANTVYMAKREVENAQIVITAKEDRKGLSVVCPPLQNENGDKIGCAILRQYYIKCLDKRYPDPIAPVNGQTEKFDIEAGKSQAVFVQLKTGPDTPSGDYSGLISVMQGGKTVKQVRLFCRVWDFALPETMTSEVVMGLESDQIKRFHNEDKYKEYYDYLLEHHVNAYSLPYDILDEKADAYMSDPRVRSFRVPYAGKDGKMTSYYEKLSSNPEWLKKAYFYPHDEPGTVEGLNSMAQKCERIRRLCPGVRIVVPFFQNAKYDGERDQIAFMSEYVDIWCPKSFCFTKKEDKAKGRRLLYNTAQSKTYPEFGQRMQDEVKEGDSLWWYVCWEPGMPYLNMYVDMQGFQNRLLFWQQKQYNVNGFLYWSCSFWRQVENPWTNMATVGTDYRNGTMWLSDEVFGDGSLLYPGSEVGIDGACGSCRLECVRDGTEEFEMLTMLEKAAGREAVDKIISKVSTSIVKFTDNENALAEARYELGCALEEALKK